MELDSERDLTRWSSQTQHYQLSIFGFVQILDREKTSV